MTEKEGQKHHTPDGKMRYQKWKGTFGIEKFGIGRNGTQVKECMPKHWPISVRSS